MPCVDNDVALLYRETWGVSFLGLLSGLLFVIQSLHGLWFLKVKCSYHVAGAFLAASTATTLLSLLNAAVWHSETTKLAALEAYERGGHNVVANQALHATCGALYALSALNTLAGSVNVLLLFHGREFFSHFDDQVGYLPSAAAAIPYQRAAQDAKHRSGQREWAPHGSAPVAAAMNTPFRGNNYIPPEVAISYQSSGHSLGYSNNSSKSPPSNSCTPHRGHQSSKREKSRSRSARNSGSDEEKGGGLSGRLPRRHGEGDDTALRRRTPSFHATAKDGDDEKGELPPAPTFLLSGSSTPRAAVPAVYTADGNLESGLEEDYEDETAEERPLLNNGASVNDNGDNSSGIDDLEAGNDK